MAGFRKAKAEQAALKVGVYGKQGRGKTFSTLLFAEGLGKLTKKRVAVVDTEHGTDFYCQKIPDRKTHPEAFDFDAIYTRSITEIIAAVRGLDPKEYGVVVIDSMTHVWEAAQAAYNGKKTRNGQIPVTAWHSIKRPYKELMGLLLSSPLHVFICGREGGEWGEDENTGEMKKVGDKMKAEGETAYEMHIILQIELIRQGEAPSIVSAYVEKDRTGVHSFKSLANPTYDNFVKPLLPYLGGTQANIEAIDDVASKDAERLAEMDFAKEERSAELLKEWSARMDLAKTKPQLEAVGKEISADIKKQMTAEHAGALREKYMATLPTLPA